MHFKFGFIHAYQDQENINVPIMFPWKEKLFVHIDIITKIFKILRVITLLSAVTRSELGGKMCILIIWIIYVLNSFVNNYLLYSPTDAAPRFL